MKDELQVINQELSRIKKEVDVLAIIAVGSSRDVVLKAQGIAIDDNKKDEGESREDGVIDFISRDKDRDKKINDVDLFIITTEDETKQLRQIKRIKEVEFDLNYFPEVIFKEMIRRKVQFVLEEMFSGKVVYDPDGVGENYIQLARQTYESGPPQSSKGNLTYLKFNLQSKLDSIIKLEQAGWEDSKEKELEFLFLSNLWLKSLLAYYFKIKEIWVPKEKRLLKVLKQEDELLYDKVKSFYEKKEAKLLKDIAGYVFYEDGVKLGDEMRFKFKF